MSVFKQPGLQDIVFTKFQLCCGEKLAVFMFYVFLTE